MALTDQVNLAADVTFQGRVRQAMVAAAIAISNEAATTVLHHERATLAKAVMNSPASFAPLFANGVAQDATVITQTGSPFTSQALVLDAAINNAVSAIWNSFFSMYD